MYSSPNIVRVIESWRWAGHVARIGREVVYIQGFDEETWEKKLFGRPRRRWEDNNKMDLKEVGCHGMDRIDLAQDKDRWRALVRAVMNLRVP